MGSEGTLGIITAAVLKLYPKPRAVETAFVALASPEAALSLLTRAKEHFGNAIRAFELLPRIALEIVLRHRGSQRDPFGQPHAWYVLLEVTSQAEEGLDELLFAFLEAATEEGLIEDATVATSLDQAKKLWDIRESLPDLSKLEGGSIKHDISVPVGSVAAFIAETTPAVLAAIPGARPVPFGHVGDGNIHYNVSQPIGADKAAFLARWDELNTLVHGIAAKYEGSISAEHGIGQLKRHLLAEVKDPVALDTMRAIKAALDPLGILNPGKVL
jgi:FAD/FMN-containing dehydrogenase